MRVSLAAVLEEDLAGGLRRVDTHAICHPERRRVRRGNATANKVRRGRAR